MTGWPTVRDATLLACLLNVQQAAVSGVGGGRACEGRAFAAGASPRRSEGGTCISPGRSTACSLLIQFLFQQARHALLGTACSQPPPCRKKYQRASKLKHVPASPYPLLTLPQELCATGSHNPLVRRFQTNNIGASVRGAGGGDGSCGGRGWGCGGWGAALSFQGPPGCRSDDRLPPVLAHAPMQL